MRNTTPRAATAREILDALRLTQDPVRLREASSTELAKAAAACAKALVNVAEATGHLDRRASAFHVIDRAGADAAQERHREDYEREKPDRHRRPTERDGATRRRGRGEDRFQQDWPAV